MQRADKGGGMFDVVVICGVLSVDLRRVAGMLSIIFLPASLPANPLSGCLNVLKIVREKF